MNVDKDNRLILLMLQIIRGDGDLMCLQTEEFPLTKIIETFDYIKSRNYIIIENQQVVRLSIDGERLFNKLCRQYGLRGLYKYIIPNMEKRESPYSITDIYIPAK